ncbi:MAG: OmpA family protein, partial [Flavobacteriaceae bacterium]|nr:OmpA family protein [Flavobacteriaceae bacterium]
MKHLRKVFFVLALVATFSVSAQDENNPWSVDFGVNAVDFYPTNQAGMGNWFDEYVNFDDHYNIIPSISRIRVGRYLGDGFSLGLAGSLNKIEKIGDVSASDLSYIGADLDIRYDLNNLFGASKWFDPYLAIGGGYTWIDDLGAGTANGGAGINFWFNDFVGLNLQSMYKHSFDDTRQLPHFQHALGVAIKFGGKDTDGDGVYDKDDECVDVFGLEAFNGCPDTDGDGVLDKDDNCVNEVGPASNQGCPEMVITEEAKAKLDEFAKAIYFNSGKSTFRVGVSEKLDLIADIMKEFKDSNFSIDGHTDSVGSNKLNQNLSESRAKAVLDYLVSKGIAASRLTSAGYGEDKPIASNNTS